MPVYDPDLVNPRDGIILLSHKRTYLLFNGQIRFNYDRDQLSVCTTPESLYYKIHCVTIDLIFGGQVFEVMQCY